MNDFDGIILGTGHNALILQAYLGKCGMRILSLDVAAVPGGGLNTIENPRIAGCRHNLHSFFHRGITAMPWWRDLGLEAAGVDYLEPELNVAMLTREGPPLMWWCDFERTYASFAALSQRDAVRLRYWHDRFQPILQNILLPEAQSCPIEPALRRELLQRSAMGRELLAVSALSPLEFVEREFENDAVRAGLLFFNGLREVDLRLRGFGHAIPALIASSGKAQMCRGGSARLAEGLVRVIEGQGGEVRCGVQISRMRVESGRAVGVELTTGEALSAKAFVASGLNPQQTFLELLPESDVALTLRSAAAGFRYNQIAPLIGLHLVLHEAPQFCQTRDYPELSQAFMVIMGLDAYQQFPDLVAGHEAGELRSPIAWGATPTLFDPTQGQGSLQTSFLWEKVPFHLQGDARNWDREGDRRGAALLDLWRLYTSNLQDEAVLDRFVVTPPETVKTLPNMIDGDLLVGAFAEGQVGRHRPFYDAGQYRTPIPGLYLCGGSSHPGGNITGLPGYNAAGVIVNDLDLPRWWQSPDFEAQLRDLPM